MAQGSETAVKVFGFIGLGLMGKPMAVNLAASLANDQHMVVYDLLDSAMAEVCESNQGCVTRGTSPRDVVDRSEFVITMLPEGKHVKSVYITDTESVCSTDIGGKTFVDCSTIDVATTLHVKTHVAEACPTASFYDAPVSGGVLGAIKATIAFFLGCHESDRNFFKLQAILGNMGKEIIPCGGPSLGIASKLCNNYLSGTITIACSEAFDMGIRAGVSPNTLQRVFGAGTAQNTICDRFCPVPGIVPEAPSSNQYKGGFKIQLMLKDYTLAINMAETLGSKQVLGGAGLKAWTEANADPRFHDLDSRVVYQFVKSRGA